MADFLGGHCHGSVFREIFLFLLLVLLFALFLFAQLLHSGLGFLFLFDYHVQVIEAGDANISSNLYPVPLSEVHILSALCAVVGGVASLHCIAEWDYATNHGSRCRLFMLTDAEAAGVVPEHFGLVADNLRKDPGAIVVRFPQKEARTICKDILANAMAVEVHEKQEPVLELLFGNQHLLFQVLHFWIHQAVLALEQPVEVFAAHARSEVAHDNPVRVQHRHDLYYGCCSHAYCFGVIAANPSQKPLHDVAAVGFPRMLPAHNEHAFLLRLAAPVGHCNQGNFNSAEGLTHAALLNDFLLVEVYG